MFSCRRSSGFRDKGLGLCGFTVQQGLKAVDLGFRISSGHIDHPPRQTYIHISEAHMHIRMYTYVDLLALCLFLYMSRLQQNPGDSGPNSKSNCPQEATHLLGTYRGVWSLGLRFRITHDYPSHRQRSDPAGLGGKKGGTGG